MKNMKNITNNDLKSPLSKEILKEYTKLMKVINDNKNRNKKLINFTTGMASVSDIIAYQIGWGKLVINWYNVGTKQGKKPDMPGEGFTEWKYKEIAQHFMNKWQFDKGTKQEKELHKVVIELINISEIEYNNGNLDKEGVWDWCTLNSGKKWPLSKWIKVNTISPYKRATKLIVKLNS